MLTREMCRERFRVGFGLFLVVLGVVGCSSSGAGGKHDSGASEVGTWGNDVASVPGLSDGSAANDVAGMADGTTDAKANVGTDASPYFPLGEVGQTNRDAGGDTGNRDVAQGSDAILRLDGVADAKGMSLEVAVAGDVPIADAGFSQGPDSPQADVPQGQEAGSTLDASLVDLRPVGDSRTPSCDPPYTFNMPSDLTDIQETYDVCMPPTGVPMMTAVSWATTFYGSPHRLITAQVCVAAGDPRIGTATGSTVKSVIGVANLTAGQPRWLPMRIYAIAANQGGTEVRAAYDLNYLPPYAGEGQLPAYPERYLKLELACGDPSAIPEFNNWTGRLGVVTIESAGPGNLSIHYLRYFLGSLVGDTTEKMFRYDITSSL